MEEKQKPKPPSDEGLTGVNEKQKRQPPSDEGFTGVNGSRNPSLPLMREVAKISDF